MDDATTAPAPLGRREQRKQETHRAIRDAALDLALAHGMESLTVDAIADAAGVSPRTFFNYFSCKEDALVPETSEATSAFRRSILARPPEEPPVRALRAGIVRCYRLGEVRLDRERLQARQRLVHQHLPLLTRQLAQYVSLEQGLAEVLAERLDAEPDDLRPALLAAVAVGILRVSIRRWTVDPSHPLEQQIDAAFAELEQEDVAAPPVPAPPEVLS
ncbi:TetR/AcrR family transcriptional regulator [Georgenia sp. Z1491]|uniref:TetR/AcrR family transcriptional regulator n=1 Tax=Georgenia sp. Z1491 TaxID=3416707 RepID=UPI003CF2077A